MGFSKGDRFEVRNPSVHFPYSFVITHDPTDEHVKYEHVEGHDNDIYNTTPEKIGKALSEGSLILIPAQNQERLCF